MAPHCSHHLLSNQSNLSYDSWGFSLKPRAKQSQNWGPSTSSWSATKTSGGSLAWARCGQPLLCLAKARAGSSLGPCRLFGWSLWFGKWRVWLYGQAEPCQEGSRAKNRDLFTSTHVASASGRCSVWSANSQKQETHNRIFSRVQWIWYDFNFCNFIAGLSQGI